MNPLKRFIKARTLELRGIPPYDTGTPNSRHMGFPMSQNRFAVPVWNWIIEQERPARIIEIGTEYGGFACCLGLIMRNLDGEVHVFDIKEPDHSLTLEWWPRLPIRFVKGDVFTPEIANQVWDAIGARGKSIVLCDGGNKRREFLELAQVLKPGDIIAAHDFWHPQFWPFSEFHETDAQRAMEVFNLERIHPEPLHQAGWFAARKL